MTGPWRPIEEKPIQPTLKSAKTAGLSADCYGWLPALSDRSFNYSVGSVISAAPTRCMIAIKRAYDPPSQSDGTRVLVDRLWPRGLRKPDLCLSRWIQEVAPSNGLRRFFGHDPARWQEFRKRYLAELKLPEVARLLAEIVELARNCKLTLVYGAKDQIHNNALVLKELLDENCREVDRKTNLARHS